MKKFLDTADFIKKVLGVYGSTKVQRPPKIDDNISLYVLFVHKIKLT